MDPIRIANDIHTFASQVNIEKDTFIGLGERGILVVMFDTPEELAEAIKQPCTMKTMFVTDCDALVNQDKQIKEQLNTYNPLTQAFVCIVCQCKPRSVKQWYRLDLITDDDIKEQEQEEQEEQEKQQEQEKPA